MTGSSHVPRWKACQDGTCPLQLAWSGRLLPQATCAPAQVFACYKLGGRERLRVERSGAKASGDLACGVQTFTGRCSKI